MWKIPLFDLSYDHREQQVVLEVLRSKWLSAGPKTREFENNFARYLGGKVHCCAVSSCTAALHIALVIAGVGPGDEVILPGLTFVADLNVVLMTGADWVLADSKSIHDWNVSVQDIDRKITSKTKAVIVVHFAGNPCDMAELRSLCKEKDILLIEDAAHAIGAEYQGQKCGTFGDMSCFSFFSNKNLSTGEGGMLVSLREDFAEKARLFRSHGMTSMTIDRYEGKAISYDVVQPGFNYRMDEIRSALGIVQLQKIDENNRRRAALVEEYKKKLASCEDIIVPWNRLCSDRTSSYHIFPILLPMNIHREKFVDFLKKKGIQTSIHYPAFNQFTYYKSIVKDKLDIANEISRRTLTLPLYPDMAKDDVSYVTDVVIEFFQA